MTTSEGSLSPQMVTSGSVECAPSSSFNCFVAPTDNTSLVNPGFHKKKNVAEWTVADIGEWLQRIHCEEYLSVFAQNNINGEMLLLLDKECIREMVPKVGDSVRIHTALCRLRRSPAVWSPISQADEHASWSPVATLTERNDYYGQELLSIGVWYPEGKCRLVNLNGCTSAEDIMLAIVKQHNPNVLRSDLQSWRVLEGKKRYSTSDLLALLNPNDRRLRVLSLEYVPRKEHTPVIRKPLPRDFNGLSIASDPRPTSKHVSMHLSEYFPEVDSQELKKTVRNSAILTKRLSHLPHNRFSRLLSNVVLPENDENDENDLEGDEKGEHTLYPNKKLQDKRRETTLTLSSNASSAEVNNSDNTLVPVHSSPELVDQTLRSLTPTELDSPTVLQEADEPQFLARLASEERSPTKWVRGQMIGSGSFGTVYMGMNTFNGELLAVKQVEITPSDMKDPRKLKMIRALEHEIELMRNLNHENIVQYRGFKIDDKHLNIFLEYVPGGSLASMLTQYGSFEENLVSRYVRQILAGLEYLHERNIFHRDIKGANILVNDKAQVKISDFGLSKKLETQQLLTNRQSMQGSAFWMAPEVVMQGPATPKADIWSLGCLVIELLTCQHPFPQLTQLQALFKLGNMVKPAIPNNLSPEVTDFLDKALSIEPEMRPSAKELRRHPFVVSSE